MATTPILPHVLAIAFLMLCAGFIAVFSYLAGNRGGHEEERETWRSAFGEDVVKDQHDVESYLTRVQATAARNATYAEQLQWRMAFTPLGPTEPDQVTPFLDRIKREAVEAYKSTLPVAKAIAAKPEEKPDPNNRIRRQAKI